MNTLRRFVWRFVPKTPDGTFYLFLVVQTLALVLLAALMLGVAQLASETNGHLDMQRRQMQDVRDVAFRCYRRPQ